MRAEMASDLWNTAAMKTLQERQKIDRKLLKPQVERRRRERMNKSLESLRAMLLPSPESTSQRRVEKAEILEHTVLFLQSSIVQDKKNQHPDEGLDGRQFLDGFSTCLHKAMLFLQMEGEPRGLQGSLPASLYQHLSPLYTPTWDRVRNEVLEKSQLPIGCRQGHNAVRKSTTPYMVPLRGTHPNSLTHCHGNTHTTSQNQQVNVRQGMWRPWP